MEYVANVFGASHIAGSNPAATFMLTNRQKNLAGDQYPTYGGYATWPEVRKAKLAARGRYWHRKDYGEYVAFSKNGERQYFLYDDEWEKEARKCARLWSQSKKTAAIDLYNSLFIGACFKDKK